MNDGKSRHTIWLPDETWDKVKSHYKEDNCATQNEFVKKALEFYIGYLNTQAAERFLPRVLSNILEDKLSVLGNRIGRLLFKMTVEESMMMHIIASDTDIDLPTLERLRVRCVQDAKRTNGGITFADTLIFQKGIGVEA